MKKKDNGPVESITEEEYQELTQKPAKPKRQKGSRRFRLISFRDAVFLGGMAAAALLAHKYHGRINEMTGCYLSSLLKNNVCVVEKNANNTAGQKTYEIKTGSDLVQVVYDANQNVLVIPKSYALREIERGNIGIKDVMSTIYNDEESRYGAVGIVVNNLSEEEARRHSPELIGKLYNANKSAVQEAVLEDAVNNPEENKEVLLEVSKEGAKMYPTEVGNVLPDDEVINQAKNRGMTRLEALYNDVTDMIRSEYNRVTGPENQGNQ